jgi:hypothetical protein
VAGHRLYLRRPPVGMPPSSMETLPQTLEMMPALKVTEPTVFMGSHAPRAGFHRKPLCLVAAQGELFVSAPPDPLLKAFRVFPTRASAVGAL